MENHLGEGQEGEAPAAPTTHPTGKEREGTCEDRTSLVDQEGELDSICEGSEEGNRNSMRLVSIQEGDNNWCLAEHLTASQDFFKHTKWWDKQSTFLRDLKNLT